MGKIANRIAVIDDELSVRTALARLLSAADFDLETYGSARDFIESLRTREPDCIVVDIHMPELSGVELQHYLALARRSIPTVVITAFDDTETRGRCMKLGASAFLLKPLDGPTLIEAVRAAIGAARI